MGYMLPLKFVRVSEYMSICATRIVAMMSSKAYQARRIAIEEKRADTLLNGCGRGTMRTVIILDNGTVVSSPYTIEQILRNIQRADSKSTQSNGNRIRLSNGIKLYDVIPDEEFNEEPEDNYPEILAEDPDLAAGDTDGDEELLEQLDPPILWDGEVDSDDIN